MLPSFPQAIVGGRAKQEIAEVVGNCRVLIRLLITVLSRSIKRHCAFSQIVTMVRLMLMYYVDFIAFMENSEKTWNDFFARQLQKSPPAPSLFD